MIAVFASKDLMSTPAPGDAAAGDAAAGPELAGEDALASSAFCRAAALRSRSDWARATASLAMLFSVAVFFFFPGMIASR